LNDKKKNKKERIKRKEKMNCRRKKNNKPWRHLESAVKAMGHNTLKTLTSTS
jgi:hypothetical protein